MITTQPLAQSHMVVDIMAEFHKDIQPLRGKTMSVAIRAFRGHEHCKECRENKITTTFSSVNKFRCPIHGSYPEKVLLRFTGSDVMGAFGAKTKEMRLDSDEYPLSLDKARFLLRKIKEEQKEGSFAIRNYIDRSSHELLFKNYSERYLRGLQKRVSTAHYSNIKYLFDKHLVWFRNLNIRNITPSTVEKWMEQSVATDKRKNRAMKHLSELLSWAYKKEDLPITPRPMPYIKSELAKTSKPVALKRNQQGLILKNVAKKHRPIFLFAALTGIRPSVIRALKVKDIDWKRGVFSTCRHFDKEALKDGLKTHKDAQEYPLAFVTVVIKQALRGRAVFPETFVFEYEHGLQKNKWQYYTASYLQKRFKKARQDAKFSSDVTFYSFTRHSLASQLAEHGAHDDLIAGVLDNSSGMVKKRYKTVTANNRANVYDLLKRGNGGQKGANEQTPKIRGNKIK